MHDNLYRNYESIDIGKAGEVDVTGWRVAGPKVRITVDGEVLVGFDISTENARAIAAQLIAAADYAEGK